jgi:hypothetical protein
VSEVDALQTTLAAEHAAVHVLGALGSRTSASATPELFAAVTDAYTAHRARRDALTRWVRDAGATPVAAAPAYQLPEAAGPEAVGGAALEVEQSCAETYAWLVASTSGERRRWAVDALTNAAVRELTFRGSPEIFPGIGEYADR